MKNLPVEHLIKILNYMRDERKHFQQMQDDGEDVSNHIHFSVQAVGGLAGRPWRRSDGDSRRDVGGMVDQSRRLNRPAIPRGDGVRRRRMTKAQDDTIALACWDCCAIYASPKNEPQCPNCGWVPKKLVLTKGDVWADPAAVIVGVPLAD